MDCDVAVLGGGPGGYTAAIRAAQLGAKVVCVEQEPELGGTCLRIGCIPTKAWVQTAHFLHQARDSFGKLGVTVEEPVLDLGRANEWKAAVVKQMTGGVASLFKANGVEWVKGTGTFDDANTLSVAGGDRVGFRSAIIATGSFPIRPPIPGLDSSLCVDSTGLLAQTEVPERLVVLGGGIIGCEFASIFETFGSEVTIVEMLPSLIPQEDEDAAKELAKAVQEARDRARSSASSARSVEQPRHVLTVHFGDGETVEADLMLVSVGRAPVVEGIGLEAAGVSFDRRARGSPPTTTGARRCRTSTPSATARATGSSRTRPSARARSPPRTRAATTPSSTTAPCRGRSTPTRRSPRVGLTEARGA